MNEIDNICEIVERIQRACQRTEEIGMAIMKVLDRMEEIETLMEEEHNVEC